jgi:hypothetical protein
MLGTGLDKSEEYANVAEKKVAYLTRFAPGKNLLHCSASIKICSH